MVNSQMGAVSIMKSVKEEVGIEVSIFIYNLFYIYTVFVVCFSRIIHILMIMRRCKVSEFPKGSPKPRPRPNASHNPTNAKTKLIHHIYEYIHYFLFII